MAEETVYTEAYFLLNALWKLEHRAKERTTSHKTVFRNILHYTHLAEFYPCITVSTSSTTISGASAAKITQGEEFWKRPQAPTLTKEYLWWISGEVN